MAACLFVSLRECSETDYTAPPAPSEGERGLPPPVPSMVLSRACFAEADDAAERSEAAGDAEDEEEDAIAVQQPHRKVEEKDIDAVIIEEEFFAGWSREEEEEYKQCVLPSQ